MAHVDALSRAPVCNIISDQDLLNAQTQDVRLRTKYRFPVNVISNVNKTLTESDVRTELKAETNHLITVVRNGQLLKQVPPSLVTHVLIDGHDKSGHPGIRKTCEQIGSMYYWPEMSKDIKSYVKSCHSCQLNKVFNHSTYGQLQPLPTPEEPLELLSTDTVVIGSSSANTSAKYMQVTIDHHTRFVWAKATKTNTAHAIISSLDLIFKSVGLPIRLLTDNATNYRSKKLKRFLTRLRVKRSFTTSYHPQTNGTNEKVNDTLVKGLRLEMVTHPTHKWSTLVQKVVDNYNNTIHSTTGFTPAYLMMGKDRIGTSCPSISDARLQAKLNSDSFKAKKKIEYDSKHKPLELNVGDLVKKEFLLIDRISRN